MSAKPMRRGIELTSSVTFNCFTVDENYLYTVESSGNTFLKYSLTDGRLLNTPLSVVSGTAGITLVAALTAVIVSSSSSRVDFVDVNTNYMQTVTTGASVVRNTGNATHQVAGMVSGPSAGIALATKSSSNSLMKIVLSPQAVSSISPSFGGATSNCILADEVSGVWFVGTTDGKVHEVTAGGTVNKTITLPSTPNQSAPTVHVGGIAFKDPYMMITTLHGIVYYYNYWTGALLWKMIFPRSNATNTLPGINKAKNGLCAISPNNSVTVNSTGLYPTNLLYIGKSLPIIDGVFFLDPDSGGTSAKQTEVNSNLLVWNVNNAAGSNVPKIVTFRHGPTELTSLSTNCQFPEGVYSAGRIIRIRGTLGNRVVEVDTAIGAGEETFPIYKNRDYIELALINPGTEKGDIREIQT